MIKEHKINEKTTWFEVIEPTQKEQDELNSRGISPEFIFYALDPNESARTEIDYTSGNVLVIYDIVTLNSDAQTEPVAMLLDANNNFYTIARESTSIISNQLFKSTTQLISKEKVTPIDIFLNTSFALIAEYINAIKNINRKRNVIQKNLKENLKVNDITSLMELQTQVIYMIDSLKTDKNAVITLKQFLNKNLNDRQNEFFDDLLVENTQAIDMVTQASEVINSINNAYSGLHNQKLDKSLRLLTVVQSIMAVPTVVTGFYGMNMKLPFAHLGWAWMLTIGISLFIILIEIFILFKNNFFDK
ncbi:MAG: magnesium transporter CorA family protein [Lactobacillaceae bacterium]|jgi:magnesium transporter|nr:magnesium transporter CorA family protein [Lactobacillaceae bacterium]